MAPLLQVKNLVKQFPIKQSMWSEKLFINAIQGVSFDLNEGETLALVGESGCGKSTLGRCILRLIEPTSGEVSYRGQNLLTLDRQAMKNLRRKIQIIFQDPYSSLNPRMTVGSILEEPLVIHKLFKTSEERSKRVNEILDLVGLPKDSVKRFPHEFSGGQRQRVGIARALAVEPEFIVCDEPVSALDVSIQAQILNLLMDLQDRLKLTYLFISHDLRVVQHISHRVAVMYLGKLVEVTTSQNLYHSPQHPYTKALLSSVPSADATQKANRIVLAGEAPKPTAPPSGCQFHPRCFMAEPQCSMIVPSLNPIEADPKHEVSCLLVN